MMRLPVSPAFEKNNLAITLQTSDYFAPYASVTILSIIENASPKYNYDLLVMTWDMREETAEKLISMAGGKDNISIRVVDVSREIDPYVKMAVGKSNFERFGATGLIRLVLLDLLEHYDVVLNFDCDMLICGDVSELFQYDISNYYMGAAPDLICYAAFHRQKEIKYTQFTDDLIYNQLKLDDVSEYLNAGMLLLNLKEIRKNYTCSQIIDFARSEGSFFECFEQDTFNGLFKGKKLELPIEWNWLVDSTGFISRAKNVLPKNDKLIVQYFEAEKNAKSYHYVTSRKPWQDASISHANEWWAMAIRTPFQQEILSATTQMKTEKGADTHKPYVEGRYLLFICDTFYQLLNALNIKLHFFSNIPADLIILKTTNLVAYKEKISDLNVFNKIIVSEYCGNKDNAEIFKIPIAVRTKYPEKYEHAISFDRTYTDYFTPVCQYPYWKMVYYQLVKKGLTPRVHIYEDGATTYTENWFASSKKHIDHEQYKESQRFYNNITDIYMYRPELYSAQNEIFKLPIPLLSIDDTRFVDILKHIFGIFDIPKEKYLFFNECFNEDGISNDIQILDELAKVVGKNNIAIKMHPRSQKMKFSYCLHGYNIFSDKDTPWEIAPLSSELDDKVLISISSNAMWTPQIIANAKCWAISLENVMKLSTRPHVWQNFHTYQTFMSKVRTVVNKKHTTFFRPNSQLELSQILQYIEGES